MRYGGMRSIALSRYICFTGQIVEAQLLRFLCVRAQIILAALGMSSATGLRVSKVFESEFSLLLTACCVVWNHHMCPQAGSEGWPLRDL